MKFLKNNFENISFCTYLTLNQLNIIRDQHKEWLDYSCIVYNDFTQVIQTIQKKEYKEIIYLDGNVKNLESIFWNFPNSKNILIKNSDLKNKNNSNSTIDCIKFFPALEEIDWNSILESNNKKKKYIKNRIIQNVSSYSI